MQAVEPRTEDFLRLHRTVLEWVAREADPDKILRDLCGLVGDLIPGGTCVVMGFDQDLGTLSIDAAPGAPREVLESFRDVVPGPTSGSCASAVHRGEAIFSADTASDECWSGVREIAARFGIRACWSIPLFSQDGEVLGTFSIYHETTGGPTPGQEQLLRTGGSLAEIVVVRRRLREHLRRQEWMVQSILEGTEDAIFVKDLAGCYLLANTALARSLGKEPHELLGTTDEEHFDSAGFAAIDKMDREVLETGRAVQYEFELPTPSSGKSRTYLLGKTPLRRATGEIHGLIGIGRDVTALRRAQLAVQESQRLESLGVLTGGIAHDFNNLLTGVLGHAELSLSRQAGDPRNEASLREISKAAMRASELIEQMQSYAGQRVGVPQRINLNAFVADSAALLNASVAKNAELVFDVPAVVGAVFADPLQLQQVLMSVLTNASEALEGEPGRITVRVRDRAPGAGWSDGAGRVVARGADGLRHVGPPDSSADLVEIVIEDRGCGIAPEVLPSIFDPFFSTKFSGRGLGLAATRGIINAHGGWVEVDSRQGRGSVFRLVLPVASAAPPASDLERGPPAVPVAPPEPAPEPRAVRGLILVADDEELVRSLATSVLEGAGYDVIVAADGQAAVSLAAEHAADLALAILDRSMPLLSGRDAFVKIRELSADVGVLLSSGYSEAQATADFESGDLAGYLEKPYRPGHLLAAVEAALGARA